MAGRNAAQRVRDLIARTDTVPGNQMSMLEGLKIVFDCQPVDPEREHSRRIEAWRGQLDLARKQLHAAGFPDALYGRWFSQVESALRPTMLNQPFEAWRSAMNESVRLCMDWCAYALQDEGGSDQFEAAKELATQLRELLASDAFRALPEAVRQLYSGHLQAVLDALELSSIDGSEALRKAAKAAVVDIVVHKEEIADVVASGGDEAKGFLNKAGGVIGKAFDLAKKAGDAADGADKVMKLVMSHGPKAVELLGWTIDHLPK